MFFAALNKLTNRLAKLKDDLNIFLRFLTDFPRFSLYPFLVCSFPFFFIVFSLHFIFVSLRIDVKQAKKALFCIEVKKISLSFLFISL
jgi:hypothetical protein